MDVLLLSHIRSSFRSASKQELFDELFGLPSFDPHGHVSSTFDVIKKGEGSFLHLYDVLYNTLRMDTNGIDDNLKMIAALAAAVFSRNFRGNFVVRQWLKWNQHARRLECEGQFHRMYRMSVASFNNLLDLLRPWLQVNLKQTCNASKGKQPIVAEIILHCTLRYLAGGSVHDIRVQGCQFHPSTEPFDVALMPLMLVPALQFSFLSHWKS